MKKVKQLEAEIQKMNQQKKLPRARESAQSEFSSLSVVRIWCSDTNTDDTMDDNDVESEDEVDGAATAGFSSSVSLSSHLGC